MPINELINEHERLSILKSLLVMSSYRNNDSIIQEACAQFGHDMSRDKVKTHLAWLEEQGTVTLENVGSYVVAELTARGQDVAEGRARIPGIKRPGAH